MLLKSSSSGSCPSPLIPARPRLRLYKPICQHVSSVISSISQLSSSFVRASRTWPQRPDSAWSPGRMYWKYTTTFPPHTIPISATWFLVRVKPLAKEALSSMALRAVCIAWYSTAPPPTVPSMDPSFLTSILEPVPLGVEPELAIMVTRTASSPCSSNCLNSVNNVFMTPSLPPRKNIFCKAVPPPCAVPFPSAGSGPENP